MLTLFDHYAQSQDNFIAFEKILDAFLLRFRLYETLEERDTALSRLNEFASDTAMLALFEEIGILSEGFNDPLGELFMLRVSRGKQGQFFTPTPVCDLMTALTLGSVQTGQSVLDPACGSGRMLLSAAKQNRHIRCYGADVDAICVKMAVMNMLLQSLSGEIAHMDSLSNSFYSCYRIGTVLRDGYHYPYYRWVTDPAESVIVIRSKEANSPAQASFNPVPMPTGKGQQGSLF